jgi:hypothetical protein
MRCARGISQILPGQIDIYDDIKNHKLRLDGTVKSLISDGAVKSLAQFRRMQRTYPYVKF